MKKYFLTTIIAATLSMFASCEADQGKLPIMNFHDGAGYISTDDSVKAGSAFTIGIIANKAEEKDVLKKFNISKSVNGGTNTTIFSQDLTGSDADNYSHDYTDSAAGVVGEVQTYTFSVTNRDGLTKQLSLKLTIK